MSIYDGRDNTKKELEKRALSHHLAPLFQNFEGLRWWGIALFLALPKSD